MKQVASCVTALSDTTFHFYSVVMQKYIENTKRHLQATHIIPFKVCCLIVHKFSKRKYDVGAQKRVDILWKELAVSGPVLGPVSVVAYSQLFCSCKN